MALTASGECVAGLLPASVSLGPDPSSSSRSLLCWTQGSLRWTGIHTWRASPEPLAPCSPGGDILRSSIYSGV